MLLTIEPITEFLGKLTQNASLFTQFTVLAVGSSFLILAITNKLGNLAIPTIWGRVILGITSLAFISLYFWMVVTDIKLKRVSNEQKRKINTIENENRELKEQKIPELENAIKSAISILDNDTSSLHSTQVLEILRGVSTKVRQYNFKAKHRKNAAAWVNRGVDRWVENLKREDFTDDVKSRQEMKEFREDVTEHLEILCKNISIGSFISPHLSDTPVNQRLGYSFPYKKALQLIKKQIEEELERDSLLLDPDEISLIKKTMNRLIEDSTFS